MQPVQEGGLLEGKKSKKEGGHYNECKEPCRPKRPFLGVCFKLTFSGLFLVSHITYGLHTSTVYGLLPTINFDSAESRSQTTIMT